MTQPLPTLPPENVGRGTVFALIALPLGVIAWLLLWSFGFIASIVAFGVAIAAAFFYKVGSGGRIGKRGGWIVTGVTVVTLIVAWFGGLVLDVVIAISNITGVSWLEALNGPYFAEAYAAYNDEASSDLAVSAVVAIAFAALGSFSVLRGVFKQAQADAAAPIATPAGFEPITPEAAAPAALPETATEPDATK